MQNYFKAFTYFDGIYIGAIDSNKTNVLGIYGRKGLKNDAWDKTCDIKSLTFLIHGTKSKSATEALALKFYNSLESLRGRTIGGHLVDYAYLLNDEPIDVDKDDNSIYEYTIDLDLCVERG